jgi:hypothetical protein
MPSASAPRPSPPPPRSGPPPERYRHDRIEAPEISDRAFRPGWRVRTQLDRLLKSGEIGAREYLAATTFRRLHERAHQGGMQTLNPDRLPLDKHCRGRRNEPADNQLAALERLAQIRDGLGPVAYVLPGFP